MRILHIRGQAMQKISSMGLGTMIALMGKNLNLQIAQDISRAATTEGEPCYVTNDNAPNQIVISGTEKAIAHVADIAQKRMITTKGLNVSVPAHSPLMEPVIEPVLDALKKVDLASPSIPWISNVTACAVADNSTITQLLLDQIKSPVRWRESIIYLKQHERCRLNQVNTHLSP